MTPRGRAPLPLLLLATATAILAFVADHPAMLAALAVGALALHLAAPRRSRFVLIVAVTIGATALLLNPFVQANGDLIVFQGPDIPIFDMQVTMEEVVAGLAIALRAFAVTVLVTAALAHCDPDRLLAAAGRLLPRSALAASIAARMLPLLERDSRAILDAARLRGQSLSTGSAMSRARGTGALAMPLVASSLERSLDVAEAMAARGYGSGTRTRLPETSWSGAEWSTGVLGAGLAALAAFAVAGRIGQFSFYPTLDPVGEPLQLAAAALTAGLLLTATGALRR
jgi:energy-coupling factor transport system permease protein